MNQLIKVSSYGFMIIYMCPKNMYEVTSYYSYIKYNVLLILVPYFTSIKTVTQLMLVARKQSEFSTSKTLVENTETQGGHQSLATIAGLFFTRKTRTQWMLSAF